MDATQFVNELEAQQYILDSINSAVLEELNHYGEARLKTIGERGKVFYVNKGGKEYLMGGFQVKSPKQNLLTRVDQSIDGSSGDFYTYGIKKETKLPKNRLIQLPTHLIFSVESGNDIPTEELYKNITKRLPKGFYIYTSAMPQAKYDNKTYADYSEVLPVIYTQCKRYEFIKPE